MKNPFKRLPTTYYLLLTRKRGQSLMEVIIGVAIATLMIVAAVTVIGAVLRGSTDVNRLQAGAALGKELSESVRVFAESDWHNIANLATGSANQYFLAAAGSPFVVATGTESVVLPDVSAGLVGYWKLDEIDTATMHDASGNNSTGTIFGNVTATSSCMVGGCRYFGGTNGYGDVPYNATLPTSGDFTFAAWVKTTSTSAGSVVAQGDGNDYASAYQIRYEGVDAYFVLGSGSTGTYIFFAPPPVNAWNHIVATVQGTAMKVYMNGVQIGSATFSGTRQSPGTPLHLGRRSDGYYLSGWLDDVRVYNRALSASEAKTIYQGIVYQRYFYIDDVARDAGGNIVTSGGANDPSTKKITVTYLWPPSTLKTIITYLTRSRNVIFRQTDWSGGAGQSGPATTTNNLFASSSNINIATTTGSLFINFP